MPAVTLGPLARAVLALAISHAPPGHSPYSYEALPACGTDPQLPGCKLRPVCADPSAFCRAPRWNAARHAWVRVETRQVAIQRYVRIAKQLSSTAQRLTRCQAPDGAPLADCEPIGWPGSERQLAIAALAVALHESGLREDVQFGYPPLGRGPAGEACLLQVALDQGPRQAMWLPEEERDRIRASASAREKFAKTLLGDSPQALGHCFEVGMRMLNEARHACSRAGVPWDTGMFSMYGSGSTCHAQVGRSRKKTFGQLLVGSTKLPPDAAELLEGGAKAAANRDARYACRGMSAKWKSSRSKKRGATASTLGAEYIRRPGTRLGVVVGGTRFGDAVGAVRHYLDLLDLDAAEPSLERIELDFLAHGLALHPKRPGQAALFEKRGPGACYVDLVERRVLSVIAPMPGHAFYGHGSYVKSGEVVLGVEMDLSSREGVISVRDGRTFAVIDRFPTFGARPHDCVLVDGGRTLAITNGGGPIDDSEHMPCVTFVDVASRKLLDRYPVDNPRLNTGHIAFQSDRSFAVVSAPRDGLAEQAEPGGLSLRTGQAPMAQVREPADVVSRMLGESLSVCIHPGTGVVAVTNPWGNLLGFWRMDGTLVEARELPNVRGVALTLDKRHYIVSFGPSAGLALLDAASREPLEDREPGSGRFSGSHIYTWAEPA